MAAPAIRELKRMTQIEMLSGLAQDMRDLRHLINEHNKTNYEAHIDLLSRVADIKSTAGVNTTKITFIAGIVAVAATGLFNAAIAYIG